MHEHSFAGTLRAAIDSRGISLERIQARLAQRGAPVSVATLSYWQNGRSRPERRASLVALRHLESILGLTSGALYDLLTAPPARSRTEQATAAPELPAADPPASPGHLDPALNDRFTLVDAHDRVLLSATRHERLVQTRLLLRAEEDGVDRFVVQAPACGDGPPALGSLWRCRPGATHADRAGGRGIELLLDRPLARGETTIVDYSLTRPGPGPVATSWERGFGRPVRQYTLEIAFDPGAVPVYCTRFTDDGTGVEEHRGLVLDGTRTVQVVARDLPAGRAGARWEWGGGPE
ncbi:hypothetical protein AB0M43_04820 [Longispora sp. NPDC051575]|uniref:hypothetical protein n=1 Tax=Longispora sp. NPDC051575 TaxID=3154943 RepID=UPI003423C830